MTGLATEAAGLDERLVVFGSSLAPGARKVLAVAKLKGLAVTHRPVAPHDAASDFGAASPFGQIPAMDDVGFRLCDSFAICQYLERKQPTPRVFPQDPQAYGRAIWLEQFADRLFGPSECRITTALIVRPILGLEPDRAAADRATEDELPRWFQYLEGQVGGPFLVGNALTIADLAIASVFASLKIAGQVIDRARWPRLEAYVSNIFDVTGILDITD